MKKCRKCSKPAVLHITEIKEGQVQALHLCEVCAQEYISTVEVGGASEDYESPAAPVFEAGDEAAEEREDFACAQCQMTFKRFRSLGRLGCPGCYDSFHEKLIPLLESIHSETQHVGKCPPRAPEASRKQIELIRLRSELKTAVEDESYEEAARLRDQIKSLEEAA